MRNRKYRRLAAVVAISLAFSLSISACSPKEIADTASNTFHTAKEVVDEITGDGEASEGKEQTDIPEEAAYASEGKYVYGQLDEGTKTVYNEIVYAIQNREEDLTVSTLDAGVIEAAYHAVLADYSEFFWLDQLSYVTHTLNDEVQYIEITPEYTMTLEEQAEYQAQVDSRVNEILAGVPTEGSDYDKALYIYETLATTVDYVSGAPDNQNILSVFVHGETVCQGYSYATQYLLEKLGIPCTTVSGTADNQTHAWNLVKLDGSYYYIDTTWGNPQFTNSGGDDAQRYVMYDYFAVTTDALTRNHVFDDPDIWPECTDMTDNYYVREDLYVDTWDPDRIGNMIGNAYQSGEATVQIKLATDELYDQTMTYFIEEKHIWDYCSGLTGLNYTDTEDSTVFMVFF